MMEGSSRAKQARGWAVAAIGSMLIYFVVVNHVDLYPWNNLVSPQLPSTLAGVVPFYALAFATGTRWLMLIGVVHSYIWLLLQVRQWWIPYLLGPTPIHKDFGWYTEHGYSETIKFLPAIADRPVPDAEHIVLQALSLLVVAATTWAYVLTRRGTSIRGDDSYVRR
jgi:hypothetical protein